MNFSPPLPAADLDFVLSKLGCFRERPQGFRILFAGASGFFGSWMLESFLYAGTRLGLPIRAIALTRNASRFAERLPHLASDPRVELMESDAGAMPVPEGPVDYIIHSLVPDAGTSLEQTDHFFQSATGRLIDIAVAKATKGFLLCSTGAAYKAAHPPFPFSEGDPLVPLDGPLSYGQIRRKVEDQCRVAWKNDGVPVKIARGFSFVGPRLPLDAGFAVGNFIRDGLAGHPITIKGDGTAIRSYLYAADMAVWLWKILLDGPADGEFNVGSEEAISIVGLAHTVGSLYGVGTHIAGEPMPGAAPGHYIPSTGKAGRELDLREWTGLRESIEKTCRFSVAGNESFSPR